MKRGLVVLAAVLLVAALASAVFLSNLVEFRGPLSRGVLTVSEIAATPSALSNGTAKTFTWNVTNAADRLVNFNLTVSFFLSGVVNGGFTVLAFDWTLNALALNNSQVQGEANNPAWYAAYLTSIGPLATQTFTLVVTFSSIGAGDYTLRVEAMEP
ncbi:MAG: hypothetical protein V3U45_08415 [bacterium]